MVREEQIFVYKKKKKALWDIPANMRGGRGIWQNGLEDTDGVGGGGGGGRDSVK